MTWIDSHCHLPLLSDSAEKALVRARENGVEAMICVGTDLESSRAALVLADRHPDVWATVGLHPHEAAKLGPEWAELVPLTSAERTVGIGETGLDYFYEHSPRATQITAFRAQIELAHERGLALVVHSRDAWDDTFSVLHEVGVPARTIIHCFSGGVREAERALELGACLSFSGIVSFKNARDVRDAARITPDDRMLVETDAPYLAPMPHRGRENEPAYVVDVGRAISAATDRTLEDVAGSTRSVARTLFGI